MVPEAAHTRTFWEHIGRYRFALDFVRGKRVLDIACGEGYGAAALGKAGALSVTAVDCVRAVCTHARRKYNLNVCIADAQYIPLSDQSVDVVVSFETIEHVSAPTAFVCECARILAPGGMLIISTPNRPVYNSGGARNPFHVLEFDEREFTDLLRSQFRTVKLYTQFPQSAAWWSYRSLAAERSPWLSIRGFWRLASWLCPTIRSEINPETRASAARIVLGRDRPLGSLFNPYIVRPHSGTSHERPYILVAVAQGARFSK
jgi:ubiquinone/menaquinone biosynthesis C-methylase UbiE